MILPTFLLLASSVAVSSRKCYLGEMWAPNGTCVLCPFCPGGQGWDEDETVPTNEAGDALTCRNCTLCGKGYYNDPDNYQYYCMKCPEPCIKKKRKEYIPCGGSKKGLCDGCISSDYVDRNNNLDEPCENKTEEQGKQDERIKEVIRDDATEGSEGLSVEWICFIVVLVGLIGIGVFAFARRRILKTIGRCRRADPELGKDASSNATVISSDATTSSSLLDSTFKVNTNLSGDSDLEADAPMLGKVPLPQARNELSFSRGMPSSGPECLHDVDRIARPRHYPNDILTSNDKYLEYTSRNIFDEGKINPMFREMGVDNQFIYSENLLYEAKKQNYDDKVLHYLQQWVKKAGRGATLDVLCTMLDTHGFPDVSGKLLNMYHENG